MSQQRFAYNKSGCVSFRPSPVELPRPRAIRPEGSSSWRVAGSDRKVQKPMAAPTDSGAGGPIGVGSGAGTGSSAAAARPPAEDRSFVCNGKRIEIRDVWQDTLEAELAQIRKLVPKYRYVAMVRKAPRDFARLERRPLRYIVSALMITL